MMIPTPVRQVRLGRFQAWQRARVLGVLTGLRNGFLRIRDNWGATTYGDGPDSAIELSVNHQRFYSKVFWGGSLGAAESLMDGDWTCNNLPGLVRLVIRNLDSMDGLDRGCGSWRQSLERWLHWLKKNSPRQARRNIHQHYDLGNEFFSLFLDPTMNYSSAIFHDLESSGPGESLHRAQLNKMERICHTLQLQPDDHVLEIGTGWGALACFAARHFGCRVTTTTNSAAQYEGACRRVEQEGLQDRVSVLRHDYREIQGAYDKVVSVEMIEAVGDQYFEAFFKKCRQILKPNGILLLQAIVIVDQRYRQHLQKVDFICKYIFPGGSLPSISRLTSAAANAGEMRLVLLQDFAPHYAETLRRWRRRFHQNLEQVRSLGFDERFVRMWDYYLAYCEAGFEERQINLVHMLFAQRECRLDHGRLAPEISQINGDVLRPSKLN